MPRRGGGKRRKRRTHFVPTAEKEADGIPRSLVLCRGRVPSGVRDLVPDMRDMFLPYTAQRLRERKSNNLRDYVAIAAQFQLTHIWLFSATERAPYLRVGRMPQGPTLTFRIKEYTLATHVRATQKRPTVLTDADLAHAPLLVMNNFGGEGAGPGVELMAETLRHSFPSIDVNDVKLSALRRVLLFERDAETGEVHVRHFALRVTPAGLSRPVRKMVVRGRVPKLARLDDVAELLEDGGPAGVFSSDSEMEDARVQADVTLPQDVKSMRRGANSKIKLVEVGPRLTLELVKVEAGLCQGFVLFHKDRKKSEAEVAEDQKRIDARESLKNKRRRDQEANVERKAAVKRARKERRKESAARREMEMERMGGGSSEDEASGEDAAAEEVKEEAKEDAGMEEPSTEVTSAVAEESTPAKEKKMRRGGRRSKTKAAPAAP